MISNFISGSASSSTSSVHSDKSSSDSYKSCKYQLLSFGVNQLEWGKRLLNPKTFSYFNINGKRVLNPKTFSYFNINGAEAKTYQWGEWINQTRFHVFTRWKQSWRWHQQNVKIVRIRRWGTFVKCWWFTHLT